MREVYGPFAAYIDPNAAPPPDLDALQSEETPAGVLKLYSWAQSAAKLKEILEL